MNVEISKARGASVSNAPSAVMSNYVCEHVAAMMVIGGIESISSQKFESGFGSRLHVRISQFKDAPSEICAAGVIIKDALAQVLSVANVTRLALKPSNEELANIKSTWEKSVSDSKVKKDTRTSKSSKTSKISETNDPNKDEIPIKMESSGK